MSSTSVVSWRYRWMRRRGLRRASVVVLGVPLIALAAAIGAICGACESVSDLVDELREVWR